MMNLETEWQIRLDIYSRVNERDEWFTCRSCECELPIEDICDHEDPKIHIWCWNCCHEFYEKPLFLQKEDLD
jgi:hypothetical protein